MHLSVVIPAYNEGKRLGTCLAHIQAALQNVAGSDLTTEIVVVDNNSTDNTAEIARQAGARVVFEPVNQIAKSRNAGGRAAQGDWIVFVDADTNVRPQTFQEMLDLIAKGNVAGGGTVLDYDRAPLLWKGILWFSNRLVIPWLQWTPGCFIFCRSGAFRESGGFDERYFAGEDVEFGKAIRRWGLQHDLKMVFLRRHPPITSIRKLDLYGSKEVTVLMIRWLLFPHRTGKRKEGLEMFYDGRR